mgnify:CR=1 FL=1
MVVVSHLFFFFDKKFGESVTRYESHPPSLELSISRQPHFSIQESAAGGLSYKVKIAAALPLFLIEHI